MSLYKFYGLPDLPANLSNEDQVNLRLREIEENKEAIIAAWIAETGLKPSDAVFCHQNMPDGMVKWWVESKAENEARMLKLAEHYGEMRIPAVPSSKAWGGIKTIAIWTAFFFTYVMIAVAMTFFVKGLLAK